MVEHKERRDVPHLHAADRAADACADSLTNAHRISRIRAGLAKRAYLILLDREHVLYNPPRNPCSVHGMICKLVLVKVACVYVARRAGENIGEMNVLRWAPFVHFGV